MAFSYWMVLIAALLPYVSVGLAKTGGIDNRTPRDGLEQLSGWRKRADWAHRNHFEAFAPFAAAVIIAQMADVSHSLVNVLATLFIAARIAYTAAYLADRPVLRSLVWTVGFGCVIALLVSAAIV